MTIGADFSIKDILITSNNGSTQTIKCQFWDLAGQPRFSVVRGVYYSGCHGAFLIYDCTRLDSFENIVNWLQELKKSLKDPIPVVLVANKTDLRSSVPISVSAEQGKKLAEMIGKYYLYDRFDVPYIETSAKTGENVNLAFKTLVNSVVNSFS